MNHTTIHHASLNHDEIARSAYHLWEREGRPAGRDQEFWFRAQEQLSHAEEQARLLAGAATNTAEVASAVPFGSVMAAPGSPVVRKLIAPAALPVADIQLETGRRSPRRKRRATP
jgi:hypothetical protein